VNVWLKRRERCGQRCEGEEELGSGRKEEMVVMQMEREAAGSPDLSQKSKKPVKRKKKAKVTVR
jgi:hypothetical protein